MIGQPTDLETLPASGQGPILFDAVVPMLMPVHAFAGGGAVETIARTHNQGAVTPAPDYTSQIFAAQPSLQFVPEWKGQNVIVAWDAPRQIDTLHADTALLAGALGRARSLAAQGQQTAAAYEIASCIDDLADKGSFAVIDFALASIDATSESHLVLLSVLTATSVRPLRMRLPARIALLARARMACSGRADVDALFFGL